MPPIAGSRANANGAECHADELWLDSIPVALGFGNRRPSVEDWNVRRASFREYSEKFEDLRRVPTGLGASVDVEKRFVGGRCRNCPDSSTVSALRMGAIAGDTGLFREVGSSAMTTMRFDHRVEIESRNLRGYP